MMSFADREKETVNRLIQNVLNSKDLNNKQKEVMNKFHSDLILKGLRPRSYKTYLQGLKTLFLQMNNVLDPSKEDIDQYLKEIQLKYKPKTVAERRLFLITFYKWFYNKEKADIDIIKNLIIKKPKGTKLPEELITPKEIKKITQVADNFRDKALIMLLYETATRKGEFLQLKIKHIEIIETKDKKYGFVTVPMGKTDSRKLPIIYSLPHVINWLNSHPNRDNTNSPLFITLGSWKDRPLGEDGLKRIVKILGERAKINKNIFPHLFRHSRLTELAKELTEQELKKFAGWTEDSGMASVYVHLSNQDVSDKILANAGLIDSKRVLKGKTELMAIECPSCNALNPSDSKYCKCGKVLDLKEAQKEIEANKDKDSEIENLKKETADIKLLLKQMIKQGNFKNIT